MHHRIWNLSSLLGKDRTPWGSLRPGLRSGSLSYPGETLYGLDTAAASEPAPLKPGVCECADVRAWLGPRRTGRRTLT